MARMSHPKVFTSKIKIQDEEIRKMQEMPRLEKKIPVGGSLGRKMSFLLNIIPIITVIPYVLFE